MADKLLSVQNNNIQAAADAIKSKAGISSSVKLDFPEDFVDTINSLDTYENAQDKVAPQTVTLTPSNTSYQILRGTHDGTDVVKVMLKSQTVELTPSTQPVSVEATGNEFLGSVKVNAISSTSGYNVVTKIVEVDNKASFTVSNLGFVPNSNTRFILMLLSFHSTSSLNKVAALTSRNVSGSKVGCGGQKNKSAVNRVSSSSNAFSYSSASNGSVTIGNGALQNSVVFAGTYLLIAWGQ